jgi:hypothetical protein
MEILYENTEQIYNRSEELRRTLVRERDKLNKHIKVLTEISLICERKLEEDTTHITDMKTDKLTEDEISIITDMITELFKEIDEDINMNTTT